MASPGEGRIRRIRPDTYLFFYLLFTSVLFLTHATRLGMPCYWDELGQFMPAALDIHDFGALIPRTALPNAHPPGVLLYVAAVWALFGVSLEAARSAMLVLAGAGVLFAFLLAIRLSRTARGAPAFVAVGLLLASPWFYSQSMLVQLDMPAMVFTALALLLFLDDRIRACAAACVVLVLMKETGAIVPAVFAAWLVKERRWREALWFLAPCAALAVWFASLAHATGYLFGNPQFTQYNVFYSAHPLRMAGALARRVYTLSIGGFHWIGAAALLYALTRSRLFVSREWRIAGTVVAAHVVVFTVLGGATLERYLLPVLPVVYAAFAAAFAELPGRWRAAAPAAALLGAVAANFLVPIYPYPLENNLAFLDFVDLQATAARFLEQTYPHATIATVWPLTAALRRPQLGYVEHGMAVRPLPAVTRGTRVAPGEMVAVFSFDRESKWLPLMRRIFAGRNPPPFDLTGSLQLVAQWSRGGHWIEIYRPETSAR
jgi:4-amino-4-deoxy-L-arabinose transferase-like glycosyltransferase